MRRLDSITDWKDKSLSKLPEVAKDRQPGALPSTGSQRARLEWATEQQPLKGEDLSDIKEQLLEEKQTA